MTQNRIDRTAYLLPALSLVALLSLTAATVATSNAQTPAAAAAQSLTGKWKVHIAIAGNEQDQQCSFTQTDKVLSGTCTSDQGPAKIAGSVDDKKVTWKFDSEYNGTPITLTYTGAFDDKGKLSGSVAVQPFDVSGDFDVSPADAAPAAAATNAPATVAAPSASAASTASGPSSSLAGNWHVRSTVQGTDYESDCTITQTGKAIGGTCKSDAGEAKIAGTVDGNKATWKFDSDYQGTPINLTYTGAFDDKGKFSGTVDVAPFNVSGDFVMTPVAK
jgi:invasion protein IalB